MTKALGHLVEDVNLPPNKLREMLIHQVDLPEFLADHLYHVAQDHPDEIFDEKTDTVEQVTGNAPQPLIDFVREHLDQFQGQETVFLGV
jgi:hypothetical protein